MTDLCFRSCLIMAFCLFLFGVATGNAWAADDVYKRGQDKEYTASCIDPTARTDGTLLQAGEIEEVVYYVDTALQYTGSPLLTINMTGGCMDVPIDLQQFPVNVELGRYAKTVTTDGLESVVAAGRTFIVRSANPNAPGQVR